MDDDAAADHGDGAAAQAEVFDDEIIMRGAGGIGGQIAEIAGMAVR